MLRKGTLSMISRSGLTLRCGVLAALTLACLPTLSGAQESDSGSSPLAVASTTSASNLFGSGSSTSAVGLSGSEGSFGFVSPSTSVSLLFARKQAQGVAKGSSGVGAGTAAGTTAVAGANLSTTGLIVAGGTLLIGGGLLAAGLSGGLGNGPAPALQPVATVPELGTLLGLSGLLLFGAIALYQRRKAQCPEEWTA